MNKFCHNCGKQLPTAGGNFCPFCGTSLLSLSSKPLPAKSPNTFTPFTPASEDDDDDSYLDRIQRLDIRISQLDVEVSKPNPIRETVGGVFMQQGGTSESRGVGPYSQGDVFLKEFQKEAGTLRQNEN